MADIRIVSSATLAETYADWVLLPNGTLDETEELANYVLVALLTDRTASPTEVLPDPQSDDRRGWWGDMDADVIWNGWQIGCKNWLLERAKIGERFTSEGDTVVRAETYTREALQPMVELRMCSAIDVYAFRASDVYNTARYDQIDVLIRLYRGPYAEIELIFQDLWQAMSRVPIRSPYGYAATPALPPPSSTAAVPQSLRRR